MQTAEPDDPTETQLPRVAEIEETSLISFNADESASKSEAGGDSPSYEMIIT